MPNPCNSGSKVYMFLMKGTIIFIIRCEPVFKQGPSYSFQTRQLPSRKLTAENHLFEEENHPPFTFILGFKMRPFSEVEKLPLLNPIDIQENTLTLRFGMKHTPRKINGWNRLKSPILKRKIIWTKPSFSGSSRESSRVYLKNIKPQWGYDLVPTHQMDPPIL